MLTVILAAVLSLPSPAGPTATAPFLFATRDGAGMSWLEANALRFAVLHDGKWSAPRTIVARPDLFVNWADFPSVIEDANGVLYAHWLQKSGAGKYSYDIHVAISRDGGATWSAPALLNRDGKAGEHGFVSLVALPGGGVGAAWLDGRDPEMSLRYATIDAKGAIRGETVLDARTCECCTTGMTMTASGPVIAYRDRSPDEIRDIAVVRVKDRKSVFVNADGWKITGCPVNGPQIDAIGNATAVAWFTASQEKAKASVALSDDGGATFGKPIRIDEGSPVGRMDVVMLDATRALVTWVEGTQVRARVVRRAGTLDPAMTLGAAGNGFPRIARIGRDVYFAFRDADGIRVARATF